MLVKYLFETPVLIMKYLFNDLSECGWLDSKSHHGQDRSNGVNVDGTVLAKSVETFL